MNMLSDNLTDKNKNQLKNLLPEEFHRIFDSKVERAASFNVLFGLLRFTLNEEHHPKSSWDNLVRGTCGHWYWR